MISGWTRNRKNDRRTRDLGHGLALTVWQEVDEDIPPSKPKYNVVVFGQRLVTRAVSITEGKRRAERAARRWMYEALLRL